MAQPKEYKIRYSKDALKFLSKIDRKSVDRIRNAIEGLKCTPPIGDIKLMKGYSDDRKRLRVGSYRIIYRITAEGVVDVIWVLDIGNRGDIYK